MNKVLMRPLFRKAYLKKQDKNLKVEKFKVGGFSQTEKRNLLLTPITSALLQARVMPGESQLGSLARAFGKGIEPIPGLSLQIKQLDEEAKARADQRAETKFASTKKVLDSDTDTVVFVTEKRIQTEASQKDPTQPRFVPVPEVDTSKPMKAFDNMTQKIAFVKPSDVLNVSYNKEGQNVIRYTPLPEKKTLRTAYVLNEDTGEFSLNPSYVDQDLILRNPDKYKPVEGNVEMMLKVDSIKEEKKIRNDVKASMLAASDVARIIRRIEKDIIQKGAFTGNAAETVGFVTGVTGFVDQFLNRKNKENPTLYKLGMKDVEDAIARLENDSTVNAKLTRFLKAGETQAAKTDIINLAYAIARAREPGGRFSVADIELALRSLGEGSNKIAFLKGLKRSGLNATSRAINDYKMTFGVASDEIPMKYKDLLANYNYFADIEIETDSDDPKSLGLN